MSFIEVHEKGRGGYGVLKVLIPVGAILSVAEAVDGTAVVRISSRTIIATTEPYATVIDMILAATRTPELIQRRST